VKQDLPITSTDAGITIDSIAVAEKAYSSIRRNFDPDANDTDESDLQLQKQDLEIKSIVAGTLSHFKPLAEKPRSSIRCVAKEGSN
jgi:hypothetical protein